MSRNWDRAELLRTSSAYWRGCTLQAGVRLDIFTLLGRAVRSLEEIAQTAGSERRGTEYLLNGLAAMGLLEKKDDGYANTASSLRLLSRDSPDYMGQIILHHHHLLDGWAQLDQAVLTGKPVEMRSYGDARERESFLMGMFNLAMTTAPRIAEAVDLGGRASLLDLGGGPGTYAVHFCLANPKLRAAVFDLPTSRPFAEQTIRRFGLESRVSFHGGDFHQDPLPPGPYGVVWLSHILHSYGPEACQQLIAKAVQALEPGGLLLIHDFFLNEAKDGPEFPALFALNMLINNPTGRSYAESEVRAMLQAAGCSGIERLDFLGPNDASILAAVA
ncbi:methyltransferase [Desulfogranum mediterraneum]|uniref:methyltransferase n=1 Tax=Desulfogranum mediterraneum TaxID=160661 RepID=UPI000405F69B|nr:methyltransferase [Desulfogranum mediterraneum]